MKIMNFINKVDSKTKQFQTWWKNLSYEKKFAVILLTLFVGVPLSIWTTLLLPIIAFIAFILAVKMFHYGKREDDMFFLLPTTMLGLVTLSLSWAWLKLLIR